MKYRKKPVVIEAIQYAGTGESFEEIDEFMNGKLYVIEDNAVIVTLEGNMVVSVGDFVIKGVNGEFYPCKPDIFEKTYESVDEYEPNPGIVYEPMCPYGNLDCVLDCNYIKTFYPDWYKELGNPTQCKECIDGNQYDDEDK